MTRYLRLVLGLATLAAVYWQLGGFEADTPRGSTVPIDTIETRSGATPDSVISSIGGPDDALERGPFHPDPELTRTPLDEEDLGTGTLGAAALDSEPTGLAAAATMGWEDITIGRNESFYVALQRNGLDHPTIMALVSAVKDHTDLRRVQRGDVFSLSRSDATGEVRALRFDVDAEHYLIARRDADGEYTAELLDYPVQRVVKAAQGTIRTNLFDALKEGGADITLADQLAEILGWDIDFFRDLRRGDTFVMVYEEFLHQGVSVRDPRILAVHFVNDGREVRAYRSENEHGLPADYKPDGSSLERQFLRAPLKFTRISSSFSHRRLHPVLKRYRPHYGVDYAAPVGTPVMATADGTVIKRTRDRASGNFVGLRHGNGYESYYLHLSRFARSAPVGAQVRQGDVIGYVGNTGWSTGPHLDYRIKKNGKWVNPRKLSLPPADPVAEADLPAFRELVARYDTMIASVPVDAPTLVLESAAPAAPVTR